MAKSSRLPLLLVILVCVGLIAEGLMCVMIISNIRVEARLCPAPALGHVSLLLGVALLLPALVGLGFPYAEMNAGDSTAANTEDSPLVGSEHTSGGLERHIRAYLFTGHALCAWGDRMWQFAVPLLFMDVFVDSLLPSAAFSLALYSCCILVLPSIGDYIDRVDRKHAVLSRLTYQNAAIIASSALLVFLIVHTAPASSVMTRQPPTWDTPVVLSFVGILMMGAVGQLGSNAQSIAVEKDWVVVIAKGVSPARGPGGTAGGSKRSALATLNTYMRRIDLTCKILAPTAFGLVLQLLPTGDAAGGEAEGRWLGWFANLDPVSRRGVVGALVLGLWNLLSFPLEWYFHSCVYAAHPGLSTKVHVHMDGTRHAHHGWAEGSHTHTVAPASDCGSRLLGARAADDPHTFAAVAGGGTHYGTIAPVEASAATTTGPVVRRCKDGGGGMASDSSAAGFVPRIFGRWMLYAQHRTFFASLSYCLLYMTVLDNGALMTSYLTWRGMPTGTLGLARGIGAVFGLLGTVLFPALHKCSDSLVNTGLYSIWLFWVLLTPSAVLFFVTGESLYSDYGVLGSMILSRVGLWCFDLANTQLMQEWVAEDERGVLNAMQIATYQCAFIVMQVLGMVFHDPRVFEVLVDYSTGVVLCAALLYSYWAFHHNIGAFNLVDELGNLKITVRG